MNYTQENNNAWWNPENKTPLKGSDVLKKALYKVDSPISIIKNGATPSVSSEGYVVIGNSTQPSEDSLPLIGHCPAIRPESLGDPFFKKAHGLKYAYIAGAMANGITSADMVIEMGRAGMIGFFGAGGLTIEKIETAIVKIQKEIDSKPYGFNLIHSPSEPDHEMAVVNLYLEKGVKLVSAAAYMRLTLPLIYYRVKGIHRNSDGKIVCPNSVIAKVSRIEVARRFFSPPPQKILKQLIEKGLITSEEAELASHIPVADDLTAEADSGGHTDNRPALSLLPTMIALKNEMMEQHGFQRPLCVGLGGGIATPESAAAAFSMGAAYILTGSINQACVESGTSDLVRSMLAQAEQADVIMAPAADMFEMGVKVQVLKRGTMFSMRAGKLYEYYRSYDSIDSIPEKDKVMLEEKFFKCPLEEEWQNTKTFFMERDPRQIEKAERDPKHKMSLIFRSYLGRSSLWSISGDPDRKIDFQIWCGPSMGAFNEWVKGSFLEKSENRHVANIAMNLLLGAAVISRINLLKIQGVEIESELSKISPLTVEEISKYLS